MCNPSDETVEIDTFSKLEVFSLFYLLFIGRGLGCIPWVSPFPSPNYQNGEKIEFSSAIHFSAAPRPGALWLGAVELGRPEGFDGCPLEDEAGGGRAGGANPSSIRINLLHVPF